MKALAITVNGKSCCTAGIVDKCCITAELGIVIGSPDGNSLLLNVNGVNISAGELFKWKIPALNLNDRIEFQVIETDKLDAPIKRFPIEK